MSTIASFPRSRRDHADDDAPGDEYGHRPCSRIGGTVDNGESVGSARHSAFVCNVGTRSFAARQTRPSDPSRGTGMASPAAPVLRSCGSRDPRQFVTRGPKSTMRQIPNRCHGECSYPQPPPVRHVKTAGILAAVAVTEPAAGTPPPAGTYGAAG